MKSLRLFSLCVILSVALISSMLLPMVAVEQSALAQAGSSDGQSAVSSTVSAPSASTQTYRVFIPLMSKPQDISWAMAGANPQRTSWVSEEVRGVLSPQWYKPFEAYIPNKIQVIAAGGLLYISTARGLYAIDAATGETQWVFPTELPLGNSPTVDNGVIYVGGYDRKLYALDASPAVSGLPLKVDAGGANVRVNDHVRWTYQGGAGFEANPLVVGGLVVVGNRDGYLYALHAATGSLAWKLKTDGPISFSAAASRDGSRIYVASLDGRAYAVALSGHQVWKSAVFPGSGFSSWWPVVYYDVSVNKEYVLLAGSHNYRDNVPPSIGGAERNLEHLDREIFQGASNYSGSGGVIGALIGVRDASGAIDTSRRAAGVPMSVSEYYQSKPYRRSYFVLDAVTGTEQGNAPFLWLGSQSGNRYPSVVGANNLIYQSAGLSYRNYINHGGILGWRPNSVLVTTPEDYGHVVDEPVYYSGGGKVIYWSLHSDLAGGAFDATISGQKWVYWNQSVPANAQLLTRFPNYDQYRQPWNYGGAEGVYGRNGDGNPPVPYRGRVYLLKGNALLAYGTTSRTTGTKVTDARNVAITASTPAVDVTALKSALNDQVQRIVDAGHLRPGYLSSGHIDGPSDHECGDVLLDYFHNPADTIWTLSQALPYLTPELAQSVKTYLQNELTNYAPYRITHVGWQTGASREWLPLPPDLTVDLVNHPATQWRSYDWIGWGQKTGGTNIPPYTFYALWTYAKAVGYSATQAQSLLNAARSSLDTTPPDDNVLTNYPFVANSYIAGYQGYLGLQSMAGETPSASVQATLNSLLVFRAAHLTGSTGTYQTYCNAYNTSRNWLWLTPELAQYLRNHALSPAQTILAQQQKITPYWFVESFPDALKESVRAPLYDVVLMQAKALILREPASELVKYIDVPVFARGDLFYIQNLVTVIAAQATP